ncbi:hypothetical protein EV356DRAFT_475642 [Viridothelium virens]|uniref:RRN7-type domain-containing protein n=1 Tax=Viridothelium virens TaxID=1048519 RepID=A0A6A6GU29_VIRVR|nr:hypothetical protein EV356DRAFT_475642 [Viridothelium virens]
MSQIETFKGQVCGIDNCTATRYVTEEAGVSCIRGHYHPELQRRELEDEEYIQATSQTRARRQKEARERILPKYTGRRQFEHYLLCYQFVLWTQASWLVNVKGLPKELEIVIRDLWSLRLQKLTSRVDLDDEDEGTGSQSQVYTSTATSEAESREKWYSSKILTRLSDTPSLIDTLGTCYLGVLLLRLPISPSDIQVWAASGGLPYNCVITAIPEAMRLPLSINYRLPLELHNTLQPGDLQTIALNMGCVYQREIRMEFPPVNMPLLLYRYIKELSLPLDVYPCVRSLAPTVPCTFNYSLPDQRLHQVPDAQIISLIIIAAKLLYPVSNPRFHPTTANEPASLSLNWQTWLSAKRVHDAKFVHSGRLDFADAFAANDADVFTWEDEQMDDYLTWYERTWTRREPPADNDFRKALFGLFPTGTDKGTPPVPESLNEDLTPNSDALEASRRERLRTVQKSLRPRKVIAEEYVDEREQKGKPTPRPGVKYERYKTVEDLDGPRGGDDVMRALYEQGAEMVGLPLKEVVDAVYKMDQRFHLWNQAEVRKEKLMVRREKERMRKESGIDNQAQDQSHSDEEMGDTLFV